MSDDVTSHAYYELIKEEHHQLGVTICETRLAIHANPHDPEKAKNLVQHLCQLVESHFAHEEEGGYMSEATKRAPHLSDRANDLFEEHTQLSVVLQQLCDKVSNKHTNDIPWEKVSAKFDVLIQDLGKHEAAENALLQEAYTDDIGTGD